MKRIVGLLLAATLTLVCVGCAAPAQKEPEETTRPVTQAAVSFDTLSFDQPEPLAYATEFSIRENEQGYQKITVGTDQTILVVPEGAQTPEGVPDTVTVLHQPLQNIYMVASASMDYFCKLDALDSVKLSSQKESGWYLPEAKEAMAEGKLLYAGKYSAPENV